MVEEMTPSELSAAARRMSFEELMEQCAPFIDGMVRRWSGIPGLEREDLRQEALVKLWWAQQRYRRSRGSFLNYAKCVIDNRMGSLLKVKARAHQQVLALSCYQCGHSRPPASRGGTCPDCGGTTWAAVRGHQPLSLDRPVGEAEGATLADYLESPDDYDAVEDALFLEQFRETAQRVVEGTDDWADRRDLRWLAEDRGLSEAEYHASVVRPTLKTGRRAARDE